MKTYFPGIFFVLLITGIVFSFGEAEEWPEAVREISFRSSYDGTSQPALFYDPGGDAPKPLLVALHTWSGNYEQKLSIPYAEWCIEKNWVFIHPNFRGPNRRPEATGSEAAVQDVMDALEYAKNNARVDSGRIYLIGASGGGMAVLLVAGRHPEPWAGVSAWVPVTDLKKWYIHCWEKGLRYAQDIVASVGGVPTDNPAAAEECRKRSVLTYLSGAKEVPIDLNTGIHDGHTGSIPIDHSLLAFNLLADEEDRFSPGQIRFMVENESLPPELRDEAVEDPLYKGHPVLLRRQSHNIRFTLFEGGHKILYRAGLSWLEKQQKPKP